MSKKFLHSIFLKKHFIAAAYLVLTFTMFSPHNLNTNFHLPNTKKRSKEFCLNIHEQKYYYKNSCSGSSKNCSIPWNTVKNSLWEYSEFAEFPKYILPSVQSALGRLEYKEQAVPQGENNLINKNIYSKVNYTLTLKTINSFILLI